jgi:hypothetical protein
MLRSFRWLRSHELPASGVRLLFLAGFATGLPLAAGQTPSPSASTASDVHIGVIERNEPVRLSSRNVSATVAGQSTGVAISPGTKQGPTHLLVILEAGQKNTPPYSGSIESLGPAFEQGWLVSVVRPDGLVTPYVANEAALASALNSAGQSRFEYKAAFKELAAFAGRRVLIVEQSASTTNPPMLAEARDLIPEVYRVDGGLARRPEPMEGPPAPPAPTADSVDVGIPETPAASAPPPPSLVHVKGRTRNGVMHEAKFSVAVKDAVRDAGNYYDLDIKVPASSLDGPVQLTYHHLHRHTDVFSERPYLDVASASDGPQREPLADAFAVTLR